MVVVINEHQLDRFRREHLSPEALLELIKHSVAGLARVAVGVGKSVSIDRLLLHAPLYERFDLVLYAAPTWNILNERPIVAGTARAPVRHLVIRPRPRARCGALDTRWRDLEARGCSTIAKEIVCGVCPHEDNCSWPEQLKEIEGIRLFFAPEQQLLLNRALVPFLRSRTKATRALVILDEAKLFDSQFEVQLRHEDLERFVAVVFERYRAKGADSVAQVIASIASAFHRGALRRLPDEAKDVLYELNRDARYLQRLGLERYGESFRYLGYDLLSFVCSRSHERWKVDGGVACTARPYLDCHLLVLSAHLESFYVGHRLGRTAIDSPFEKHRFLHTGTRIFNLSSRTGAHSYFKSNHRSILDVFALAIARNIELGRSTLLVSRLRSKKFCAEYLTERLAGWGYDVRVDIDANSLPPTPDPRVVALIHYGVLGINDYSEYDAVYCLNSYYVSPRTLNEHVQEFDAPSFRVELEIVSGPQRRRRARVVQGSRGGRGLEHLADDYLRRLEIDPVIQAVGRARFATKPREVVTFQMADLRNELPGCVDVSTPTALRQALGLPSAHEVDEFVLARRGRERMRAGLTGEKAAKELGVARATLFRALRAAQSLKTPIREYFLRRFETPPSVDGGAA